MRAFRDDASVEEIFGVPGNEIPSVAINSSPGDLIIWNFRTIHGSYNGGERRRLFSLNFGEAEIGSHDGPDPAAAKPVLPREALSD